MTQYKTCTKCGQTKNFTEFYKCKSKKDGLSSHCKECRRIWRLQDSENQKIRAKNYYEKNKQKVLENNKKWVAENPEKIAVIKKRYRDNNKEKVFIGNKRWEQANPEKVKRKVTRRRALKKKAITYFISSKDLRRLSMATCFFCTKKADTIEHLIPLTRGGTHGIGNLVAACRSCNSSKRNKFLMEWKKSEVKNRLQASKKEDT
jgi:5-methylcytosine-specific restriction endonuclease McrA